MKKVKAYIIIDPILQCLSPLIGDIKHSGFTLPPLKIMYFMASAKSIRLDSLKSVDYRRHKHSYSKSSSAI